jgi:archaellum component FlaC
MKEKNLLEQMAKIVSEIQAINICIDDARTNRIARIRYQKFKSRLRRLVEAHKKLTKEYEAPAKEINPCTNQKSATRTYKDSTG